MTRIKPVPSAGLARPEITGEMYLYALYYKNQDGTFEGPAVGLFESQFEARNYVYQDGSCPRTEFEIVKHEVHRDKGDESNKPKKR